MRVVNVGQEVPKTMQNYNISSSNPQSCSISEQQQIALTRVVSRTVRNLAENSQKEEEKVTRLTDLTGQDRKIARISRLRQKKIISQKVVENFELERAKKIREEYFFFLLFLVILQQL
jgi:hypothetical protein